MARNSSSVSVTVLLYTGGEIVTGVDGVCYSSKPVRPIRIGNRIKLNKLYAKIYKYLHIDSNQYALRVTARYPIRGFNDTVLYEAIPITDDYGLRIMLNAHCAGTRYLTVQLYVETVPQMGVIADRQTETPAEHVIEVEEDTQKTRHCGICKFDPGPTDCTVLTMGEEHRSSRAWAEGHAEPLYCRGGTQYLKRLFDADDRIVRWIRDAGFYGIYRIAHIQLDWHLVTAFVERWRPETHTFHLPHGEATITLEDVAVLFGLPIDGKPVTGRTAGPVDGPADHQGGLALRRMCERLLGVVPPDSELQGARIRMRYLEAQFRQLRADADAETVARYARAHILRLICGMLFCDLSGNFAHLMFLPLLEDPTQTRSYSWGSATLAWLYREMCRAAHLSRREISGPLRLLQIWAWERCPSLAPSRLGVLQIERDEDGRPVDPVPLAYRWRDEMRALSVAQHTLPWYRFELDMHREHEFIWRPYTDDIIADLPTDYAVGSDLWVARVPLVCFHIIEWYLPDRVLRQFGYRQGIPDPFLTSGVDVHGQDLHNIDGRGRGVTNWTIVHDMYVTAWEHRREHIIPVKAEDGPLRSDDPYFSWYRSITRRFLNRTAGVYMSLADILHEVDLISPDPRVQNLVRAGLELVHDNGRQTHIPRPNPTARGGRAALVRGVRAAPVRAVHAPRASRRPLSHAGEPPVVQSEYVFGSSASYAYSPGADVAGPSSRHPDAPSVSYQLDDIVDAEDVDAPAMPPHSRPDSLCESSPHPLHMDADYAVPLGRDDRHTGRRRDRTPDADDQEGEDKRRRQPP